MNYLKKYQELIEFARTRVLEKPQKFEEHHILPKSLKTNKHAIEVLGYLLKDINDVDETTALMHSEHWIVHLFLVRIFDEKSEYHNKDCYFKMVNACWRMIHDKRDRKIENNKEFKQIKEEFVESIKYINTLEGYVDRFGEVEGLEKYNKMCKSKSFCNTLDGYIQKFGEIEGYKNYEEHCKQQGFNASLEGYIKRYGEIEGIKRYNEFIDKCIKSSTLEGYIERYGEIEGTKKYKESCKRKSECNTLEGCIEKFGVEEGTKVYNDRCEKRSRSNTLEGHIEKYGVEEGTKIYNEHIKKISNATSGENNPMHGRTPYDIHVEKYGVEEADRRKKERYRKMVETSKENVRIGNKVCQYDTNLKFITEFESIRKASRETGINRRTISYCCKNSIVENSSGFVWRFKNTLSNGL